MYITEIKKLLEEDGERETERKRKRDRYLLN
jgi:hypothetical protein